MSASRKKADAAAVDLDAILRASDAKHLVSVGVEQLERGFGLVVYITKRPKETEGNVQVTHKGFPVRFAQTSRPRPA